jgi:hypothetical protein
MVEIKGMDKFLERIENASNKSGSMLEKAMAETAILAVSEMQLNTPVRTGRLRSSMHFETPRTQAYVYNSDEGEHDGKFSINLGKLETAFGTNVEYAPMVNDGPSGGFFQVAITVASNHLPKALKRHFKL